MASHAAEQHTVSATPEFGGFERRGHARNAPPHLRLVAAEHASEDLSTEIFNEYFEARKDVADLTKPEGAELKAIQKNVRLFLADEGVEDEHTAHSYGEYAGVNMPQVFSRLSRLHLYLQQFDRIDARELTVTEQFMTATRTMYESPPADGTVHSDADGSFAFIVPARMSRFNKKYGQEVEMVIPSLRYVPRELRASMMVGLPPFIIDRYKPDADGRRGYLVFAPVYPDMTMDLERNDYMKASRIQVNNAVDFAYGRLGTAYVGLGASIPSMTNLGKTIKHPNVITTTGHGGTIALIHSTIEQALKENRASETAVRQIGVLGLGAIGGPIAEYLRLVYPDSALTVFDKDEGRTGKYARMENTAAAQDEADLIRRSQVIVSALPGMPFHLDENRLTPDDIAGKIIVDDSQPGAFIPAEVKAYGGTLAWPVGRDGDGIVRESYTYGDTLAGAHDLFGCEAEVASLYQFAQTLRMQGLEESEVHVHVREVAIREAVKVRHVKQIAKLFKRSGVAASALQAFGVTL